MTPFATSEMYQSQIPALQLLIGLGYEYLSPARALTMRGGKKSNLLLEEVLRGQLEKINRIQYKGTEYSFSEANIQEAVQKLKNVKYDGLLKTNENIYNLITLGTALEQTVENDQKSFNLNYIDWKTPTNNQFHVVPEYGVERSRSTETVRPDIVLFVNGIPLGVIECKSTNIDIEDAVSQNIRNQGYTYIPKLFTYAQLIMAVKANSAKYATVGSPAEFWGNWNELEDTEDQIATVVNTPLSTNQKSELFTGAFAIAREYFDNLERQGRSVTEQDKAIHGLCHPERLLDLTYRFTLFDNGIKKIARYQQFFVVRSTMRRIKQRNEDGKREGGFIWHTQGSGKSLTMVMLTRALTLDPDISGQRVVLVTDRENLDEQLGNTFEACGLSKERATSGKNLVKHLRNKVGIITTLIHKFDTGWVSQKFSDESYDIFMLVDESHRTNYDILAGRMRKMLPNSCYIGFTGTPLLQRDRNTFSTFGPPISPNYPYKQAVDDKAVLPLLYEGRHVEMKQDQDAIDRWFERHTSDLTKKQQADLKKKYARANMLNNADQVVYTRAFDISEHYRANWQNTGFKAQLVAPNKAVALKYHEYLKGFGYVTSEVIISAPNSYKGHTEVDEGSTTKEVGEFWDRMMKFFGSEEEYNRKIINSFKDSDTPEILIVVDKLLTGFDAPRNTVLYLCRPLKEHTLLQAIARVNRLYENKDFGHIVDYAGTLRNLDEALTMYEAFKGFKEEELTGMLTAVNKEVKKLSDRHSHLLDLFREVKNRYDEEEFERLLADEELRGEFYERLTKYDKTLRIALSTENFIMTTEDEQLKTYRDDLKWFKHLRSAVKLRYAETIDYHDYEHKIKKLLDSHIQASEVVQLHAPVDILNDQNFVAVKEEQGIYSSGSAAAKADTIAYRTRRIVRERMGEDPFFYKRFSNLIQQAIDDFRANRMSDMEYLDLVTNLEDQMFSGKRDDVPDSISKNSEACAYYGVIRSYFPGTDQFESAAVKTALAIQKTLKKYWKVDFWSDGRAQNYVQDDLDDFLYDQVNNKYGASLGPEQMDGIFEDTMRIAKNRRSDR